LAAFLYEIDIFRRIKYKIIQNSKKISRHFFLRPDSPAVNSQRFLKIIRTPSGESPYDPRNDAGKGSNKYELGQTAGGKRVKNRQS
jgi:hypothetical protein